MDAIFTVGKKTFVLDRDKAEAAFNAKRVINGRDSMAFNLLPLKYQWAYDLYRTMKANHWEPEDIQMQTDIQQWQGEQVADDQRGVDRRGLRDCSAARGREGD